MNEELVRVAFVEGKHDRHRWLHVAGGQWPTEDVVFVRKRKWNQNPMTTLSPSIPQALVTRLTTAVPCIEEILVRPFRISVELRPSAKLTTWELIARALNGGHFWVKDDGGYTSRMQNFHVPEIFDQVVRATDLVHIYDTPAGSSPPPMWANRDGGSWDLVAIEWAAQASLNDIQLVSGLINCIGLLRFEVARKHIQVWRNAAYRWSAVDRQVEAAKALVRDLTTA